MKVQGSYLVEAKADGFVIVVDNVRPRCKVSVGILSRCAELAPVLEPRLHASGFVDLTLFNV